MFRALTILVVAAMGITLVPFGMADDTSADRAKDSENRGELFSRLDTDGDGMLTAEEATDENRRLFERLVRRADKNDDGKVSREEFAAAQSQGDDRGAGRGGQGGAAGPGGAGGRGGRSGGPGGPRPGFGMGPLMRSLDTDGDGKLSASEIKQAADSLKKLDKNGDGDLTREELVPTGYASFGRGQDRPEFNPQAMADRMLEHRDKDGDGKLQKEELSERMQERFDRLDTNQDGALDKEELQRAMEQRRGGPGGQRPDRPGRPGGPDGRPDGRPADSPPEEGAPETK